jgi:inorganic phosphate transporter, PiT family
VGSDVTLVVVVAAGLTFAFTNGYRDTAEIVAASISTRAVSPRAAVTMAAVLGFVGALVSLEVAATIAENLVEVGAIGPNVIAAAIAAAIIWNLLTWNAGIASSSSQALIGALIGAAFAAAGSGAVDGQGVLTDVLAPAVLAPAAALFVALVGIGIAYRAVGRMRPGPVGRGFRFGQLFSGGLLALAHGANDAQKTIGVITLGLVANGTVSGDRFEVPFWAVVSSAAAIALGTYGGGWRAIRTIGSKIIKIDAAQGFTAQAAGAATILVASVLGYPVSTTQVGAGSVVGAGAARRLSASRWGFGPSTLVAWVLTLPGAAAVGAAAYGLAWILGDGAGGALVVLLLALALGLVLLVRLLGRDRALRGAGGARHVGRSATM